MQYRNIIFILSLLVLGGCASEGHRKNRELMNTGTSAVITGEMGLVFGERCGGGGFRIGSKINSEFSAAPGWTEDSRYFFISLPAGTYTIAAIGSVHGAFEGRPPLEFTVTPGKATYVGAIYPSWWTRGDGGESCQADWPKSIAKRIYNLPSLVNSGRSYEVYILNNSASAVKGIGREFPKVDFSNYIISIVR